MVVGDLMLRKVGADHTDMMVECFQGNKIEQLHRVIEKRHIVNPETLLIHMGTNDLRPTRNNCFCNRRIIVFVGYNKKEIPNCTLVLS
jgi:hypothetical protein